MTRTFQRTATATALSLLLAFGSPAMTASAQTPATVASADGTLLSVSASGEASRAPDVATLSAGVVTQAADANAAMRENAAQMTRVLAAIRKAGVAERDEQTSGINLHPTYRHVDNEEPRITGYSASNTVTLKVRDIARLGEVLDALVASGANNVNGPSFGIDQPDAVYDEARRKALEQGRRRADMYAEALGLEVRRIVSISEGGRLQAPQPMFAMRAMAMDAESTDRSAAAFLVTSVLEAQRHPELISEEHDALRSSREFVKWAVDEAIQRGELSTDTDIPAIVEMLVAVMWGMGFYAGYVGHRDDVAVIVDKFELLMANKLWQLRD